ncbi:MAG: TRAP transporter substrate-binding protein DctP [Pseudomonadota bacterium]
MRILIASLVLCALVATPTPVPSADPVVWKVSLWGKRRAFTEHVEKLAKLVSARTGGSFRIELYYGGLSPSRQNLDGIAAGKFEMAQFCSGYHPEKNQVLTVLELPFLGVDSLEQARAASFAVYAHPMARAEMAQWNAHLLMPTPLPQYNLVGRGEPPVSMDWFRGKKIRASGGMAEAFRTFAADTVSLTATETRENMQTGNVEAVAFAQHAHFSFDTISLAEWWTSNLNPGTLECPVVVNAAAFDALSDEHRSALEGAVMPAMDYYIENYRDIINKWKEVIEVFDIGVVRLDPSEIGRMRDLAATPLHRKWVAEMTGRGLPAEELLGLVQDTN